jgi:glycosyltransferase involved in cell wall biosynthesis
MLDVITPPAAVLFESVCHRHSYVTVAVTLYNYAEFIVEALETVRHQDLANLDLVVVDDCSTDGGEQRVLEWLHAHNNRFGRSILVRQPSNQGLAASRNQGFALAATPFVFVLDADNQLYPRCLAVCLAAAQANSADAVYTILEVFGDTEGVMGTDHWDPAALRSGNYIDAMALIRRATWQRLGGYRRMPANGWEDYDLWLKFSEAGLQAMHVPQILCRYRQRETSMLRSVTNKPSTMEALCEDMRLHHPGVPTASDWMVPRSW